MWRVSWQDYRGWRRSDFREPHPDIKRIDYSTKIQADEHAALLRADGMTVCVGLTPGPRRLGKKLQTAISDPPFNADWKLTE